MSQIDNFKCDVRRYDTIDSEIKNINDRIKPLQLKLKELKDSKKQLEGNICSFMQTNDIGECKLLEGALVYKESKNVVPLSKNGIKENLLKFFTEKSNLDDFKKATNEEKAEILFSYVYDNREYIEKNTLKRI
jgi:predicted  nucleic acid-binding Zn-ribbon protein